MPGAFVLHGNYATDVVYGEASHDFYNGCKFAVQLLGVIALQGSMLPGSGGGGPN